MRRDALRLYPEEGGAGPVWTTRGPLALSELRLSDSLAAALEAWQGDYESDELGLSEDAFDAMGKDLAQRLANETGREVVYEETTFTPARP